MQVTSVCRPILLPPPTTGPSIGSLPVSPSSTTSTSPRSLYLVPPLAQSHSSLSTCPSSHSLFVCRHQHQLRCCCCCCCLFVCLFVQDTSTHLFRFSVCVSVSVFPISFLWFSFSHWSLGDLFRTAVAAFGGAQSAACPHPRPPV